MKKERPDLEVRNGDNLYTEFILRDGALAVELANFNHYIVDSRKAQACKADRENFVVLNALKVLHSLTMYDQSIDELSDSVSNQNFVELLRDYETRLGTELKTAIDENEPIAFDFIAAAFNSIENRLVELRSKEGTNLVGRVKGALLQKSWTGQFCRLTYSGFCWKDNGIYPYTSNYRIPAYTGKRTVSSLKINTHVNEKLQHELVSRGERTYQHSKSPSYLYLDGSMDVRMGWEDVKVPSTGRVMIDNMSCALLNPNLDLYSDKEVNDESEVFGGEITHEVLMLLDPTIWGFSFKSKHWGKIHTEQLGDIPFRTDAFNQLVMEGEDKKLILSLVKNVDPSATTDFVNEKGGGCVFLFHGKPGLGKTLTAEAVAETVKKPLYAVSVGELGTDVEMLEKRLSVILQTAQRWNAVLLIDEADIFLEARESGDVERNAMVGTFLRLLEYYNGILILTTNRVKDIDKAFYSRISFARKYHDHSKAVRAQIIENLLEIYEIKLTKREIREVSKVGVNGRQLKNSLRLAKYLAKEHNRPVNKEDLMTILNRVRDFEDELKSEALGE